MYLVRDRESTGFTNAGSPVSALCHPELGFVSASIDLRTRTLISNVNQFIVSEPL